MADSREFEYWYKFNGGLNLTTATQQLDQTETPDSVDMDFASRGGFTLRGGFQTQGQHAQLDGARFLGGTYNTQAVVLIQGADGSLLEWDGATVTDTGADPTDSLTERMRMAAFNDFAYLSNGRSGVNIVMTRWDGSSLATLTNTFNDDYETPTTGNMPLARHVAANNGFLWVADTVESSVRYPARVRFSHEQNVESWATDDWFNVGEPGADDPVTSMEPFGDALLIFKRSSVWALYGENKETFILQRLASATGICTCGAVAVNAGVCYWFSTDGKLMAYNGENITSLSQPIDFWSQTGKIKHGGSHRLMWSDGRLWLSLEAGPAQAVERWLFIYDPTIKGFTRYNRPVNDLTHWSKLGEDGDPLFLYTDSDELYRYDASYETDTDASGPSRIDGHFRTAWMTAGETATRKRWKRPRVTGAANGNASIKIEVFTDFNDMAPVRSHTFQIGVPADTSLWGTMLWGDLWSSGVEDYYGFARLGSSGSAYAVSYRFSSPDNTSRWWVDSIAVPFRRKQIK